MVNSLTFQVSQQLYRTEEAVKSLNVAVAELVDEWTCSVMVSELMSI